MGTGMGMGYGLPYCVGLENIFLVQCVCPDGMILFWG